MKCSWKWLTLVLVVSATTQLAADSAEIDALKKKAEAGDAVSQNNFGVSYSKGEGVARDSDEAAKWYRKAADQGYAVAQFNLGNKYYVGEGLPKDFAEAVKWYRKAADQGYAEAQFNLGNSYSKGEGIPKDFAEAVKWYRKAADQGYAAAQNNLGKMYADGEGVPRDEVEGLAWTNIGAASGSELYIKNRSIMEARLGRQMTLVAQQRSKEILKEFEAAKRAQPSSDQNPVTLSPVGDAPKASGSGAIVTANGYVLTAAHVVAGASSLKVYTAQGIRTAKIVRVDEANDIAVLQIEAGTYAVLPIAPSRGIRLGQTVATVGFPNIDIQGFSPKVTKGEISSLNGVGDDPRSWQVSVPVQPGSSGGALLDENGNLIGVVVSKLGIKAAQATGDIPQNVNYAVKSTYALALLEPYLNGDAPAANQGGVGRRFEDMVAKAQQSAVLILVY